MIAPGDRDKIAEALVALGVCDPIAAEDNLTVNGTPVINTSLGVENRRNNWKMIV